MRLARAPQSVSYQALAVTVAESLAAAVSTAPPTSRPSIVPPSDALIGRQDDLGHLWAALLIEQRRLVTLPGPGGIGKTRLALQVAADLAPHFHDRVTFVALAPVADSANLVMAVAEALDCPLLAAQSPEAALLAFLRERAILLVLDNLEHLLGASHGSQVGTLLRLLITSLPQAKLFLFSYGTTQVRNAELQLLKINKQLRSVS